MSVFKDKTLLEIVERYASDNDGSFTDEQAKAYTYVGSYEEEEV